MNQQNLCLFFLTYNLYLKWLLQQTFWLLPTLILTTYIQQFQSLTNKSEYDLKAACIIVTLYIVWIILTLVVFRFFVENHSVDLGLFPIPWHWWLYGQLYPSCLVTEWTEREFVSIQSYCMYNLRWAHLGLHKFVVS